jgi:hypothetical protein
MSYFSNQLLLQRLLRKPSGGGGGAPGPDSVGTSQIINGTITTADISNEAITQAKLHPDIQLQLAEFQQRIFNLEFPGFYGNLKIINDNSSDTGATMTITVQSEYFDEPTGNTVISQILASTVITKGSHVDIPITIDNRLINEITPLRMYYVINKDEIQNETQSTIVEIDDQGGDEIGNFFILKFYGNYADFNGGNAEISFSVTN